MRVRQFGCDVKLEVAVIRDDCISEFEHYVTLLLECLQVTYKNAQIR